MSDTKTPKKPGGLQVGISSLWGCEDFSDFLVRCGEKQWKVHKNVLCTQSEYFRKACTGKFKEAKENTISLNDDDPDAVNAVLQYLYQETYDLDNCEEGANLMVLHVRIFALSEKFMVDDLRMMAAKNLATAVQTGWKAVGPFSETIVEAYNTVQDTKVLFNNALADTLHENCYVLFHDKKYAEFRKAVGKVSCFAMDAATLFSDSRGEARRDGDVVRCRTLKCDGKVKFIGTNSGSRLIYECNICQGRVVFVTAENRYL